MTTSLKVRHCLSFEPKVSEPLEAPTAAPGASMSDLVNGAVIAYLKQRGASQIETQFKPRLDFLSGRIERIERDLQIVMESIALFIHYQLIVTVSPPAAQLAAAQAAGSEKFQRFIDQVSRRIASGTTFGADVKERVQRGPPKSED